MYGSQLLGQPAETPHLMVRQLPIQCGNHE